VASVSRARSPDGSKQGDRQRRAPRPDPGVRPPHRAAPGWAWLAADSRRAAPFWARAARMRAMPAGTWATEGGEVLLQVVHRRCRRAPGSTRAAVAYRRREGTDRGRAIRAAQPTLLEAHGFAAGVRRVIRHSPAGRCGGDTHRHPPPGRRHGAFGCQKQKGVAQARAAPGGGRVKPESSAVTASELPAVARPGQADPLDKAS